MKDKYKIENMAVFIEFLVGAGLGLFFHWVLNYKEAAFIIFGIGVLLSLMTYLLREELARIYDGLTEKYGQCHEIIFAISQISDSECHAKASEVLDGAKKTIEWLQQGYIPLGETEFWLEAARGVDNAQTHVHAVDTLAAGWDSRGAMVNYYSSNLRALERGVKITRIFIVNRDGFPDPDTQRILAVQLKDGIDARLAYRDELPSTIDSTWVGTLSYNFAIYDGNLVTDVFTTFGQYFGRKTTQNAAVAKYQHVIELIEHNSYKLSLENDNIVVSSLYVTNV